MPTSCRELVRPASDVHVRQRSCLILGYRSRWRVNPPPAEWRDRPGGSRKTFRVEEIDNVTHTGRHTLRSSGRIRSRRDQVVDTFKMPTLLRIAIEFNDQLNVKTTMCTERGLRECQPKCTVQQETHLLPVTLHIRFRRIRRRGSGIKSVAVETLAFL
jgi:hypothetical protein